ncbi:MAG: hypothetical protein QM756_44735 [Polyangiaceae bacterium]
MEFTKQIEKAHADGFSDGVLAERLNSIRTLDNIAESTDIHAALQREHSRLLSLQAKEGSAKANAKAAIGGNQNDADALLRKINNARAGGSKATAGGSDFGDLVADEFDRQRGKVVSP